MSLRKGVFNKKSGLPFVSVWRTGNTSTGSSSSNQIKLPLISTGSYGFVVKWGDGSSNYINIWNQTETTHTYAVAGDYTIEIRGLCRGWAFSSTGDRLKLLSVNSWGSLKVIGPGAFFGCRNLNLNTVTDILDITSSNSLYEMFRECVSLTSINKINEWDFSNILNFGRVFYDCNIFNQNLGNININNVTAMDNLFYQCNIFNNGGSDSIKNWPVSKVTNFSATFYACNAFNQPLSWVTSSATTTNNMFRQCTIFNQPLAFDMSNNLDFGGMFYNCPAFRQNLGSWNVSKGTNFGNFMFAKTPTSFPSTYLDNIYNGWSTRPVIAGRSINFGTAKYTSASSAGRAILTGSPNNWSIADGGI